MNYRKIIFFLFSLGFAFQAQATEVGIEKARIIAKNIFFESFSQYENLPKESIIFSGELLIEKNNILVFYIFNFALQKGFVIVAADDAVYPVLGYCFQGNYYENGRPPALVDLLENYKDQILYVKQNKMLPDAKIKDAWRHYLTPVSDFASVKTQNVLPLLSTIWDQGCYYNANCPVNSSGPCGHVWAGCVATAMAQIMKFWNYPAQGNGSHSYNAPGYGLQTANFGNTNYNWLNMPNNVNSANAAVAQLLYHCGVSVNMYYSASGSGAQSYDARDALVNYFRYSSTAQFTYKGYYSNASWENLLRNELDAGRPVYYAGADPNQGGHAFVCDGYQNNNYFHFNWGWSGYYNGYYYVSSLSPGSSNFSSDQEIIFGIQPLTGSCTGFQHCVAEYGIINDGSGNADYENNADCHWLIQPLGAVSVSLKFTSFNTVNGTDIVSVYDGADTVSTLLGSFSGNNLPALLQSTGGSMYIHFISNDSITQAGWEAEYYNTIPPKCGGITNLTSPTASFDDGSGNSDYGNLTDCKWLLEPPGATSITLTFNTFSTEQGYDFVKVYNGPTTSSPILLIFSGSNIPPPKTSGSAMLIHFTSDEFLTFPGWEVSYTSTGTSEISEIDPAASMNIYPNPCKDFINLYMENELMGNMKFQIADLLGRTLAQYEIRKNERILTERINCSSFPEGYYLLRINSGTQQLIKSFLIE